MFKTFLVFLCLILVNTSLQAQIGIGTASPDPSSVLDISSSSKGLLAPRMNTTQRTAITSPANGLLVYDTTAKAFFFYETTTTSWIEIPTTAPDKRNNYKLVKTVADLAPELAAGGGSKYLLTPEKYYEINGTIILAAPIDLNEAYVSGLDANEDILFSSGTVFAGNTGGSIRNLTITGGGTVFNITGGSSVILQNTIIANNASVGTISGVSMFFSNIVQFVGNSNGITYANIANLLISNNGWFGNNSGTFEKFTGTFSLIQKISGFSQVNGTAIGFDVSANPTVTQGVLIGTAFTGTLSSGKYIKGYNPAPYTGFNFTNAWFVNSPGIPLESDFVASGNIYYNGGITTGFVQSITDNNPINLSGPTTAVNLMRVDSPQNNRLTYKGKKTRTFQINAALSVRGNSGAGDYYGFFIRKNGTTTLTETNTLMRVNSTSDISSNSISGTVELAPNDYVEIWAQRLVGSGTNSLTVFSLNLSIK